MPETTKRNLIDAGLRTVDTVLLFGNLSLFFVLINEYFKTLFNEPEKFFALFFLGAIASFGGGFLNQVVERKIKKEEGIGRISLIGYVPGVIVRGAFWPYGITTGIHMMGKSATRFVRNLYLENRNDPSKWSLLFFFRWWWLIIVRIVCIICCFKPLNVGAASCLSFF